MRIYLNSNNTDEIIVKVKDEGANVETPDDIIFNAGAAVSSIIGEIVNALMPGAPMNKKKDLADGIVSITEDMVKMYYDAMIEEEKKRGQEIEIYGFMRECFDMVLNTRNICENEIASMARERESRLFVEEIDGMYNLNISFGDTVYTLWEVPVDLSEEEIDKESMKASIAATVLFDKAFPNDESKNPVRQIDTFNIYHDLIKKL